MIFIIFVSVSFKLFVQESNTKQLFVSKLIFRRRNKLKQRRRFRRLICSFPPCLKCGGTFRGSAWKGTLFCRDSREPLQNNHVLSFLWCENDVGKVWLGADETRT